MAEDLYINNAVGLCWYQVTRGDNPNEVIRDRLCDTCAITFDEDHIIIRRLSNWIFTPEQAVLHVLSQPDSYCAMCGCTLYVVLDASEDDYFILRNAVRAIYVPPSEEHETDSGIEEVY